MILAASAVGKVGYASIQKFLLLNFITNLRAIAQGLVSVDK